ncbi:MAG: glycosyltransferase family 39 protein [Myxococcales bacterium]|nr:glycosyltransferase family 39 protein [Myxococcales bacterium]MBL0193296.1 glycosyltransferase family 39 protein [Myxococcales bacterium]
MSETPLPEEAEEPAPAPAPSRVAARARAAGDLEPRDHAFGLGLGALYVVWLLRTARNLGFARDEGFYFSAASRYATWFRALSEHPAEAMKRPFIDSVWATNHEHPSLMKSLFALSWMVLHEKWKVFADASTAFRFPGMVMMGLAVYVTYLFGTQLSSRRAGLMGAALLGLMPNVFYHAHLACFDVPIMAMWIACIYVYWRSQRDGGLAWAIAAGVMYGLTLETKHNAWMLPGVFLPHALLFQKETLGRELKAGRLPVPAALVAMAVLGPIVFIGLWPWMWNEPVLRWQEYFAFHMNHEYYNMEFFGKNYFGPPSPKGYMPFMILATVPTVSLLLTFVGASSWGRVEVARVVAWARGLLGSLTKSTSAIAPAGPVAPAAPVERSLGQREESTALLFLSVVVPLAVFLLPRTPIFGGTKHWITAYPFLMIFAGHGFDRVLLRAEAALKDKLVGPHRGALTAALTAGLGASVLVGPLVVTQHSHPFGLSSYVPIVGGAPGAADLGLNRQFWGFTTQSLDPWLRVHAPANASVFIHDTAWDSWLRMLDERRLRTDLRGVGSPSEADFAIVHHELHMAEVDYNIWSDYGHVAPAYVLTHDGVPVVSLHRRVPAPPPPR